MADNEEEPVPPSEEELERLRDALRVGASEAQARILQEAERYLSSEEIAYLLGSRTKPIENTWIPELLKNLPNGWSALAFVAARSEAHDGRSWLEILSEDSSKAKDLLIDADAYIS